jgi:hypothetical protein
MAGKSRFERSISAGEWRSAQIKIATSFQSFSRTSFFQNIFPKHKDLRRSHERNRGNRHFLTKLLFVRDGDDKHSAFVAQLRTKC